jgi:3-hydroxyisobutyrate dehydrogenase
MGLPMASNLVKSGFTVKGFDLSEKTRAEAKEMGISSATSVAEVAADVDYIVTSLPRTADVEKVMTMDGGVFKSANKNTYILDTSTISPLASKEFAEAAKKQGLRFLDAPMSGGIMGAQGGTLTFMVGADSAEEFDHASTCLAGMGKKIFNCGGPGNGEIAKIANNMILGVQMCAVSEGLVLGERLGIDPKILSEILGVSTSSCWSVTTTNPRPDINPNAPASRNYEGGFQTALIRKDLALALEIAEAVKVNVAFGEMAMEYYRDIEKKGHGGKDFGIVFQYIQKNKGM